MVDLVTAHAMWLQNKQWFAHLLDKQKVAGLIQTRVAILL